jgi:hypothetical protein
MFQDFLMGLIPLTAILMGIGAGIVAMYLRHKRQIEEQKTIRMALDKGIDLPDDFFKKVEKSIPTNGVDSLRRGIFWTLLGVALFVALLVTAGLEGAVWAGIPFAIGVGCLLYHALSNKKAD